MGTNRPTLNRLNKSYNFGFENIKSNTEILQKKEELCTKCPALGYETSSPLGANRPVFGYGTSKPLGTNRPTWVRIVLGTKRAGYETSIIQFQQHEFLKDERFAEFIPFH